MLCQPYVCMARVSYLEVTPAALLHRRRKAPRSWWPHHTADIIATNPISPIFRPFVCLKFFGAKRLAVKGSHETQTVSLNDDDSKGV